MAPLIKLDDQPAVSLMLVKPSQARMQQGEQANLADLTPTDGSGVSRAQLMQMIYALLLLVGQNISVIQQVNAESQLSQGQIAQAQATATQEKTSQLIDDQAAIAKKQADAQGWDTFANVMKWVGVGVGLLIGALLCETPLGFMLIAAVIAFTASPLFNMTVSAIAGGLEKCGIDSTWSNIIAQAIILVVLTIATCGAEGLSTGITKLASTAGEDAAQGGTQVAVQAAKQASQEAAEEASEEVAQQASSQASKTTEEATSKVSAKDFKPRWSYASASVFTQTLTSTNLVGELITEGIEAIPGNENAKKWAEMILTIMADLAIAIASYKGASNTGSVIEELGTILKNPKLAQAGLTTFIGGAEATTAAANGGVGYNQYEQGKAQEALAPLRASLAFGESFFKILTQITSLSQQTYKSTMDANKILFNTNFSADWQACVAAQQYQA